MRNYVSTPPLSVQAIAGTYVVLLGIDLHEADKGGVLGFAIERTDHGDGAHAPERYYLRAFKTFEEASPDAPYGSLVSTLEYPVQGFLWEDFTAKPGRRYTYRILAMRGKPKFLEKKYEIAVDIETEAEKGMHSVYFNRGVGASQAYSRKFGAVKPGDVPGGAAWTWLSRGLYEALLAFIGQARSPKQQLLAAFYEFEHPGVLEALGKAHADGATVRIIVDDKSEKKNETGSNNRKAIEASKLPTAMFLYRKANPSYIQHNKFMVLVENGVATQVWTGSTNITDNGIFGHSNVGHSIADVTIAKQYLDYWTRLSTDPPCKALTVQNEATSPYPIEPAKPPLPGCTCVFSPRKNTRALEWYAAMLNGSRGAAFFTQAFSIDPHLADVLLRPDFDALRYILLDNHGRSEKQQKLVAALRGDPDNRVAVGSIVKADNGYWKLLQEWNGMGKFVKYVHTKYILVDPLSDDPLVITGSGNFSDESVLHNDENMLIIRGNTRVSDIYLGEFMRLFKHYYFRQVLDKMRGGETGESGASPYLTPDDSWLAPYYVADNPKCRERRYFAGKGA